MDTGFSSREALVTSPRPVREWWVQKAVQDEKRKGWCGEGMEAHISSVNLALKGGEGWGC